MLHLTHAGSIGLLLILSSCGCPRPCGKPCAPSPVSGQMPVVSSAAIPTAAPLPAGCEKLTDGAAGVLSPDGRRLAFVTWRDVLGNHPPIGRGGLGDEPMVPTVRVRNLATGEEWAIPDERPSRDHLPLFWGPQGALVRNDGSIIDCVDGAPAQGIARPPAGAQPESIAWTGDGARVAYVAFRQKPGAEEGVYDSDLFLLDKGGEPSPVPLGDGLPTERSAWSALPVRIDGGRLAWSPDGGRLFARLRVGVRVHWRHFVRSGIIERDGRMRVSATSAFGDEFGEDGWIGWGRTVWGAKGERFVTLLDRGDWKPLVLVASADGVATDLVSDDHSSKWSPAIEPNGRRVAYFASSVAWTRGQAFPSTTIRIVDRLSPTVVDLPLGADGLKPNGLTWTPDGSRLLYELIGDTPRAGIYAQTVPSPSPAVESPRPCPPLATLISEAFESDEVSVLGWAVDRARESWTGELGPAVERALHRWAARGDYESKDERSRLLDLVRTKVLRAALPDVLLAANAADTGVAAIETVSEWLGEDAPAALDPIRTTAADAGLRAMAAAEMVRRGDPRGWETLAKFPKGESSALWILARVDDPRAIDLLIECLPSVERVASGNMFGTPEVGDVAELMLARRTGKTFDRDQVKWTAWWNDEAKRVRPDVPERNPAVEAFYAGSRERERRTSERR